MAPSSLRKMGESRGRSEGIYASPNYPAMARSANKGLGLTLLPGSQIQKDKNLHKPALGNTRAHCTGKALIEERKKSISEQQNEQLKLRERITFQRELLRQIGRSRVSYGTKVRGWKKVTYDHCDSPLKDQTDPMSSRHMVNYPSKGQKVGKCGIHVTRQKQKDSSRHEYKRRKISMQAEHDDDCIKDTERSPNECHDQAMDQAERRKPDGFDGARICSDIIQKKELRGGPLPNASGSGIGNAMVATGLPPSDDAIETSQNCATHYFYKRQNAHRGSQEASSKARLAGRPLACSGFPSKLTDTASVPLPDDKTELYDQRQSQLRSLTRHYPCNYSAPTSAPTAPGASLDHPASSSITLALVPAILPPQTKSKANPAELPHFKTVGDSRPEGLVHESSSSSASCGFGRRQNHRRIRSLPAAVPKQPLDAMPLKGFCTLCDDWVYRLPDHQRACHDDTLVRCGICGVVCQNPRAFHDHEYVCTAILDPSVITALDQAIKLPEYPLMFSKLNNFKYNLYEQIHLNICAYSSALVTKIAKNPSMPNVTPMTVPPQDAEVVVDPRLTEMTVGPRDTQASLEVSGTQSPRGGQDTPMPIASQDNEKLLEKDDSQMPLEIQGDHASFAPQDAPNASEMPSHLSFLEEDGASEMVFENQQSKDMARKHSFDYANSPILLSLIKSNTVALRAYDKMREHLRDLTIDKFTMQKEIASLKRSYQQVEAVYVNTAKDLSAEVDGYNKLLSDNLKVFGEHEQLIDSYNNLAQEHQQCLGAQRSNKTIAHDILARHSRQYTGLPNYPSPIFHFSGQGTVSFGPNGTPANASGSNASSAIDLTEASDTPEIYPSTPDVVKSVFGDQEMQGVDWSGPSPDSGFDSGGSGRGISSASQPGPVISTSQPQVEKLAQSHSVGSSAAGAPVNAPAALHQPKAAIADMAATASGAANSAPSAPVQDSSIYADTDDFEAFINMEWEALEHADGEGEEAAM